MNRKIIILSCLALFAICMTSCDSNRIYQKYIKIDDYIWNSKDLAEFTFDIEDTVSIHNLYINIRHSGLYPFNNLWLFITSVSPEGYTSIDTVQCILADPSGKWLGDGSGDIWDSKILWKQLVRFPSRGTYSVTYKHGMRLDPLPGILDVGFRVERIKL